MSWCAATRRIRRPGTGWVNPAWHDRMGPGINVTYRQILEAFDRAIALDSAFAPAYSHAIQLALELDGPDRAMVYVKGMRKAMRQDPPRLGSRMTEAALLGQRDLLLRLIDSASAFDLSDVAINLGSWSDSLDALRLVLESAARGRNGEYLYGAPATITTGYRDDRLLYRGHLQAVCAGWRETQPRQIGWCALLGAVPADSFRQLAQDRWEAARRAPTSGRRKWAGVYWVLPWLAGQRDVATLSTIDQAMVTAQAGNPPNTFAGLTSRYMKASVSAYLALARGDSAGALARFKTLPRLALPILLPGIAGPRRAPSGHARREGSAPDPGILESLPRQQPAPGDLGTHSSPGGGGTGGS